VDVTSGRVNARDFSHRVVMEMSKLKEKKAYENNV
jgi:hypothetical protein